MFNGLRFNVFQRDLLYTSNVAPREAAEPATLRLVVVTFFLVLNVVSNSSVFLALPLSSSSVPAAGKSGMNYCSTA